MPVEAYIQTGERTMLSYLLSPCTTSSCDRSGEK